MPQEPYIFQDTLNSAWLIHSEVMDSLTTIITDLKISFRNPIKQGLKEGSPGGRIVGVAKYASLCRLWEKVVLSWTGGAHEHGLQRHLSLLYSSLELREGPTRYYTLQAVPSIILGCGISCGQHQRVATVACWYLQVTW
jgi:hypothetical protein